MKKPVVLIVDRFSSAALLKLQNTTVNSKPPEASLQLSNLNEKAFDVRVASAPSSEDLSACNALIIRVRTKVDKDLLARMPELKLIVTATSGFDHIDVEEALKRNIQVCFAPEGNVYSASELTWGLLLATARKIPQASRLLEKGEWDRERVRGQELFGKTLGIIGLGRIGSRVAKVAQVFGMETLAFDPYLDEERFKELNVERIGMKELLRSSDFVTLHVPFTKETKSFINGKTLELMNDHACLINTSRGPVVSEQELVIALDEGTIAGCGLDVFEQEPLSLKSHLRKRDNIVLLPHIGGNTFEAFERTSLSAASKVIEWYNGASLSGDVLKEPWYVAQRLNQGFKLSID